MHTHIHTAFWTNGGPGCSGLIGFMTEQGPFRPNADMTLTFNQYAWNQVLRQFSSRLNTSKLSPPLFSLSCVLCVYPRCRTWCSSSLRAAWGTRTPTTLTPWVTMATTTSPLPSWTTTWFRWGNECVCVWVCVCVGGGGGGGAATVAPRQRHQYTYMHTHHSLNIFVSLVLLRALPRLHTERPVHHLRELRGALQ